MTPKFMLIIVLLAVILPVCALFGCATQKNLRDMEKEKEEEKE